MSDLTAFLLARLDETERAAEAWRGGSANGVINIRSDGEWVQVTSPSRVLAECEAKRQIVEYHLEAAKGAGEVAHNSRLEGIIVASSWALHFLVQPYADHPDFDEAWRP